MKPIAEILPKLSHGQRQEISLQRNTDSKQSALNKLKLSQLLSQICALQKAYGKNQEELETLVEGFAWLLDGYEIPEIMRAMKGYLQTNSDIPAPNDVMRIIKENRQIDLVQSPSIEALQRYKSLGIPLMPHQEKILLENGATA